MLGLLLCAVAVGSPRALMHIIKVTAICTTALVTPAHGKGDDQSQSNDAKDDHDYDDPCPYGDRGHLAHFGVPLPRIMRQRRYRGSRGPFRWAVHLLRDVGWSPQAHARRGDYAEK